MSSVSDGHLFSMTGGKSFVSLDLMASSLPGPAWRTACSLECVTTTALSDASPGAAFIQLLRGLPQRSAIFTKFGKEG